MTIAVLDASKAAPAWVHILPRGEVRIEGGDPLVMDDEAAVHVLDAFAALSHDVVIDYEHQTMDNIQAPAAGWIQDLDWRADGLWARVSWTATAAAYIRNREYRYLSPVLAFDKTTRRIKRLVNCALTNQPAMMDAPALVAKLIHDGGPIMNGKDKPQDPKPPVVASEAVLKELGLEKDADEAAVLKALKERKTPPEKEKPEASQDPKTPPAVASQAVLKELGLDDKADEKAVLDAVAGLKAPASAAGDLGKQVHALKGELSQMKADRMVEQALADGQTTPAEVDAWGRQLAKDHPDQFELIVLKREKGSVVPVKGLKPAADKPEDGLDETQVSVNKALGVDEETWNKHGPKVEKEA